MLSTFLFTGYVQEQNMFAKYVYVGKLDNLLGHLCNSVCVWFSEPLEVLRLDMWIILEH
jgi:hypothetical protein